MNPKEFWGTDKPVVVVDIDGTLCEDDSFPDYDGAKPLMERIKALQALKRNHFIVLWSARYEADRKVTERWLHEHHILYDRLILGKIPYDVFIEENSFNSPLDLLVSLEEEQSR